MLTRRTFALAAAGLAGGLYAGVSSRAAATSKGGTFEITKPDDEWRRILTKDQYYVLRKHGTERAGSSPLDRIYTAGTYHCAGCDLPLFPSETKYDSGTGWPSFWKPIDNAVGETIDNSLFMTRTEIHCRRCGGHLGHVFPDGPPPTRQRYCMNGVALKFVPKAQS